MNSTTGRSGGVAGGLMILLFSASTAAGQWHASAVGVAEYDTKQTLLLLAGLSASPGGRGVAPVIGVQGYHLGFDNGPGRTNVFVVRPYVGLENNYDGGQYGANIGYSFSNEDVSGFLTSVAADQGSGTVVSANWDHWGRTGELNGYQVLGSYNFNSDALWARGRYTRLLNSSGPSQRRFGGEVAYLEGHGYNAWQPGAVLELHDAKGNILGLGAGLKFFGNGGGNAVYFKVEGVVPLFR